MNSLSSLLSFYLSLGFRVLCSLVDHYTHSHLSWMLYHLYFCNWLIPYFPVQVQERLALIKYMFLRCRNFTLNHIIMWRLADVIALLEVSFSNYGWVVSQSTEQDRYYCERNTQNWAMAIVLMSYPIILTVKKTILNKEETHVHRYCSLQYCTEWNYFWIII